MRSARHLVAGVEVLELTRGSKRGQYCVDGTDMKSAAIALIVNNYIVRRA